MKDLYNHIDVEAVLDPIAVSATATITDIDLAGANSATLLIHLGVEGGGQTLGESHKLTFVLYDSDDGTTYAVVETADMIDLTVTSGVILTYDDAAEDNTLYKFGYIGGKRYLQLIYTETGTISVPIAIILVKGHLLDAPPIA
jgi:hypothetical protein